jgi:peptide chain release factor 1
MDLADKFERIVARAEELRSDLSGGLSGEAFSRASRELSELGPVVARIEELRAAEAEAQGAEQLLADPEMRDLAEQELRSLREKLPRLAREIQLALLPKDEADERSAILEIRPAAGGDEAALFAAELFAAYQKYAAARGWRFELMEFNETELGGLKEGIAEITRPACAGHGNPGPHPHQHRHRRRPARSGGGGCAGQRV